MDIALTEHAGIDAIALGSALDTAKQVLSKLGAQATAQADTLAEKKEELVELEAATELAKSWTLTESRVRGAKQADRFTLLAKPMPRLLRAVTELAKIANDQTINESFDVLFNEECAALRASTSCVKFVGH